MAENKKKKRAPFLKGSSMEFKKGVPRPEKVEVDTFHTRTLVESGVLSVGQKVTVKVKVGKKKRLFRGTLEALVDHGCGDRSCCPGVAVGFFVVRGNGGTTTTTAESPRTSSSQQTSEKKSKKPSPFSQQHPLAGPLTVLGLKPGATMQEVTKAFRALVLNLHPDRLQGKSEAERAKSTAQLREVLEAHKTVVSNPSRL